MKLKNLISAENICKGYNHNGKYYPILSDVSLNINCGQTLAIVGASGMGKSTLLQILGTLDKPDSGKLFYKNKNLLKLDGSNLANFRNKTIGFVFQFHHLLGDFSALENTMIPALIGKVSKKMAQEKAEHLLIYLGLKEQMTHKPYQLSGGERQRVAIARALIQKPEILLADEPTGNLDTKNGTHIQELLLKLNYETGIALVLVTHSVSLASCMSRSVTISKGKLL